MKTPEEVRKLAKSKFDSKFRYNAEVQTTPIAWSLWKTAFDAGYNDAKIDAQMEIDELRNTISDLTHDII